MPCYSDTTAFGATHLHSLSLIHLAHADDHSPEDAEGRVILVERGRGVSLVEKARKAQIAGAVGVIVVDDGQCDDSFQHCGHQAGGVKEGGFGSYDTLSDWAAIHIPVWLVTAAAGEKLRRRMKMKQEAISKLGVHNMTIVEQPRYRDEL